METIYQQLKAAGVPLDYHESDLYAKVTPDSKRIMGESCHPRAIFTDDMGHEPWYELPFAYDPFWR